MRVKEEHPNFVNRKTRERLQAKCVKLGLAPSRWRRALKVPSMLAQVEEELDRLIGLRQEKNNIDK